MEHDLLLDQYVLKQLVIKYLFLEKGFSKSLLELSISKFCGNEVYKVEKSSNLFNVIGRSKFFYKIISIVNRPKFINTRITINNITIVFVKRTYNF